VAQLSGAIRRLADEPNTNRRALAALNELLGANYLLASDLSSMPVLVKLRARELDVANADAAIAGVRERVVRLLDPDHPEGPRGEAPSMPRAALSDMPHTVAMDVLARRLDHIEHAAEKVVHLAARPVIEDL
jgi:hypothetical protein